MITEESNRQKENFDDMEKLKEIIKEVELPTGYSFDYGYAPFWNVHLTKKSKFFWVFPSEIEVAQIYQSGENILFSFKEPEDLEILRETLEKSKLQIKIVLEESINYL